MKNKKNFWLISVFAIGLVSIATYTVWREVQKDIVLACTLSIHKSINSLKLPELLPMAGTISSDWTPLQSDSDRLILMASQTGAFDIKCISWSVK
ncbi:MAG: hypothetical protein AABN95_18110 [Acidobacteriota bacterium]